MDKLEMAKALLEQKRVINPGQTTTAYGIATSESENGLVMVDFGGDTVSPDDDQSVECETTFKVYADDEVLVSLIGADGSGKTPIVIGIVGRGDEQQEQINSALEQTDDLWTQATDLRTQIIQSANNLKIKIDTNTNNVSELSNQVTNMMTTYATNEYIEGQYKNEILQTVTQNINSIVETYDYTEIITGLVGEQLNTLKSFVNTLNGEIRRGLIYDPDRQTDVLGIAISQTIQFYENASDPDEDKRPKEIEGNIYYRIKENQTFGFYTSYGWQFYVNGHKVGWFDSMNREGALQVESEIIENKLTFGDYWEIAHTSSGVGFRFVGG